MASEEKAWHRMEPSGVLEQLGTPGAKEGLSRDEAEKRLSEHGPNKLPEKGVKSPWLILFEQLSSVLVVILIVAGAISWLLGDTKDALAIGAIVVLNSLLGLRQEYRAEKAMAALREMAAPTVRVRRGGSVREVSSEQVVPGDIVLLEAGNIVPADCRLLESHNLRAQEAALTGESEAVEKDAQATPDEDASPGDRRNMAYMGTIAAYGRATGVVVATGLDTELGQIAEMLQSTERERTPLQRRLDRMGRVLAAAALLLVGIILLLGWLRGEAPRVLFLTAVSMAVAVIPEGLPAVVTIALALAGQRMLDRKALIRKLPAVETLGSVTVICADKTGTLTENRMQVTDIDTADSHYAFADDAGEPPPEARLCLVAAALCNDAEVDRREGEERMVGDPTEKALLAAASKAGLAKPDLEEALPRETENPFSSERKRMSTGHRVRRAPEGLPLELKGAVVFCKGAVDAMLDICDRVWSGQGPKKLDEQWLERIEEGNDRRAGEGKRVLGVAFRPLGDEGFPEGLESGLVFLGVVSLIDPPRKEAPDSVRTCREAGIRVVMMTGDHPLTAAEIARRTGIESLEGPLTGRDLAERSVEDLEEQVDKVNVYARVSPEHKLKLVDALRRTGQIVAMTGDGVNDAPALKKADIGVAMGIAGTDVSKEAADMVLLDDNFSTIVGAVEQGRVIYSNIRRFVQYLLSCNLGEIWVMLAGPLMGMPLPLLPLQILWMNLVTDGLPALALGMEKGESDTMQRPPRAPGEGVFARGLGRDIGWIGTLLGAVSLLLGFLYWREGLEQWQTMTFTTLVASQIFLSLAMRSRRESLLAMGPLSNRVLAGAVAATILLQLGVIYLPFAQGLFGTTPLTAYDLLLAAAVSTIPFWAVEAFKKAAAPSEIE